VVACSLAPGGPDSISGSTGDDSEIETSVEEDSAPGVEVPEPDSEVDSKEASVDEGDSSVETNDVGEEDSSAASGLTEEGSPSTLEDELDSDAGSSVTGGTISPGAGLPGESSDDVSTPDPSVVWGANEVDSIPASSPMDDDSPSTAEDELDSGASVAGGTTSPVAGLPGKTIPPGISGNSDDDSIAGPSVDCKTSPGAGLSEDSFSASGAMDASVD